MQKNPKKTENTEINFFESIWFGFLPYWPLFALLSILLLTASYFFLRNKKPDYSVVASLVIDDDKNSTPDYSSQPFKALNVFEAKQNVDNEVLILQSRTLMKKVVINLHLYAPIIEKGRIAKVQANQYSPILIEAENPELLAEKENIHFTFDPTRNVVLIEDKLYLLNEWNSFGNATLRFTKNPAVNSLAKKNFYFSLYNPNVVADELLKNLKVNTVNKLSTVVQITYKSEVPEEGAAIVNNLLKEYLNQSLVNSNQLAANTVVFVDDRLRDVERDLDSIEQRTQQYRSAQGIVDLSEQGRLYLQNVAENDRRLADINAQLAVLGQVEQYVSTQSDRPGVVPTALNISDPVLEQLLSQLNELELKQANLRTTTGENNPIVVSVQREIQKIRPSIKSIVDNQRNRLNAIRSNLLTTSNRFGTDIRNIPQQERELLEISRQQAVKRDLYSFLLQRREEAALSNASSIVENRIIDWAEARTAKVSAKEPIFFLGAIVAAFALGIVYIILREVLSNKILFRSYIESMTVAPVVGEIFFAKKVNKYITTPDRQVYEQFHRLQASLGLFHNQNQQKRILITSTLPNEGKSFVSKYFAVSLALTDKRVVLVDANLQRPNVSTTAGRETEVGLIGYLQGKFNVEAIIQTTDVSMLDRISAGGRTDNSITLLSSERLNELFTFLSQHYEYIVVDTPPVELSTDAFVLNAHSDLMLYIIRHGVTAKKIIRKIDINTGLNQVNDLKIIFNGIKGRGVLKKYFGFGYGYGREEKYSYRTYSKAS